MILKEKFFEATKSFMDCASLYEKSLALADIIDEPENYNIENDQVQDMRDIMEFHWQRYTNAARALIDALVDILANGKSIQMEYLGFEVEACKDFSLELLHEPFFVTFAFSVEARSCKPEHRVEVFLSILKKELAP